jgi:hypothetical protein
MVSNSHSFLDRLLRVNNESTGPQLNIMDYLCCTDIAYSVEFLHDSHRVAANDGSETEPNQRNSPTLAEIGLEQECRQDLA